MENNGHSRNKLKLGFEGPVSVLIVKPIIARIKQKIKSGRTNLLLK